MVLTKKKSVEKEKNQMKNQSIYRELQKHLNTMPIGFPASKSGAEIKVLRHIFTPEEARIVCFLTYKPETLETIFNRIQNIFEDKKETEKSKISCNVKPALLSSEELAKILDQIQKKGGIESRIKMGKRYYCNSPLVVGIYEMQVERLTTEFLKDFSEYNSDINFGLEFLGLKKQQMRTIPVQKSITPMHNVSHFDEVLTLLEKSDPPFVVVECICRKKSRMEGQPCKVTDRKDTCLAVGNSAATCQLMGIGREITRQEAIAIIESNQKEGLVLQPSNTEKLDFICSCCGCCCGMLSVHQKLPIPMEFWSSNFYAVVDTDSCRGCGVCERRCQVGAIKMREKLSVKSVLQKFSEDSMNGNNIFAKALKKSKSTLKKNVYTKAVIDLNVCLGCGVCVPACPNKSIVLVKKEQEIVPPKNREELNDAIMAKKQGSLEKIKVAGKLARGMIKTGNITLLKRL